MSDIGKLDGINPEEVRKLRDANINTVEDFLTDIDQSPIYAILNMYLLTGIKPLRLAELVPSERLPIKLLPNEWIENLSIRSVDEAPPDYSWLKRRSFDLQRFWLGLKGNWLGLKKNLLIFVPAIGLLIALALGLRAVGRVQSLPSPFALHERAQVLASNMKSGSVIKSGDLYLALLPPQRDFFKPDENLAGLILARDISGQTPLRFQDILRPQMVAAKDIQAGVTIKNEDATQTWTTYEPNAVLTPDKVCGYKTSHAIRKGGTIFSEFIESP